MKPLLSLLPDFPEHFYPDHLHLTHPSVFQEQKATETHCPPCYTLHSSGFVTSEAVSILLPSHNEHPFPDITYDLSASKETGFI
ncbi:MAG: hypothetical protein Q4B19_04245, partial [Clostridia bacterium]|nr:hypothetical protein [Clostridia bacterium]